MKMDSLSELRELYDFPSGRAKYKVLQQLDKHSKNFIKKSPFLVMSTTNKNYKQDASPRGGISGFVKIIDDKTIVIPDSKGNNRLDSITNIVETGAVGLLFLIPGVDETLRINGNAYLSTDKEYLQLFSSDKNPPKACIIVAIEELFLHCAKALMRSKLWDENSKINRNELPSMGKMLKDQIKDSDPIESQEEMIKRYQKDL
jgi:PPOX class probable FMN-dependent enzyme